MSSESPGHRPFSYYLLVLLPKNLFSRLCGFVAELHLPGFVLRPTIHGFVWFFKIDMTEYSIPIADYKTFNEFFTRPLKPEARKVDPSPGSLVCPVDGTVGQIGTIEGGNLIQAKGLYYTVADLLGDVSKAQSYEGGSYITIYLAPDNYHRIHSMVDGTIQHATYIPGDLWTVSSLGVNFVPNLFTRNERLISYIKSTQGESAMVKVGATVVGKIRVKYHSIESNFAGARRQDIHLAQPFTVKRGDELGVFELGSTVVCLFQSKQIQWKVLIRQKVQMGQALGEHT
ncbi:archaetidylserine decarboxylase [Deltaproteobacteria bacterium TL4]